MKLKILIILCAVGLAMLSCGKGNLTLAKNGETDFEIVHLDNASESQYKSAQILQQHLHEIGGAQLEIVSESSQTAGRQKIYLGNIKEKSLISEQVKIHTEKGNLFITGGSDAALQNAVYEFLERYLNYKWYAPGVADIPKHKSISLQPINYSYTPQITTRTVHSRLFYENHEFADQHKVTYEAFPTYVPTARVHTFHRFMPEETFYRSHPEYYAMRGDKRLPTQLCLTNKNVLKIVTDSVASYFNRYPEASVISVSQDDNQQYCQCENCHRVDTAEGSPAGTMIKFVNEVAKVFPDKTISTLAYQHTRKPPKIRPEENVLITLCSIECDRSAPIAQNCEDFAQDLEGWGKLSDNIRIWDYTTQFTNFLAPFPNLYTLKPNIELFRDNNAKWIFEQHSNNPSELFELRSYITAKLLWNPDLDFNDLLIEFTDGYYEEAGPFVRNYVTAIHQALGENPDFFLFLYGDPSEAFDSFLNPNLLTSYTKLFNDAEQA
ncbi:MAG: DUF4838 domain-containing protein, partial [Bacteroidota bacterium]